MFENFFITSSLFTIPSLSLSLLSRSAYHALHETSEAPESIHLVLRDDQNGSQQVAHPLYVAWQNT